MRRLLALALIALTAAAAAATAGQAANQVNFRGVFPFTAPIYNPCTGENVDGEIRLHYLLDYTINGSSVSGMELLQYSAHGVGLTTGANYAGNEVGATRFKTSLVNGQATMTNWVTFHLTTPGGGNNMVIRGASHTTINANGVVTVSYDNLSSSCG